MSSIRRILVGTAALVLGSATSLAIAQAQPSQRDGDGAVHFFYTPAYERQIGHQPSLGTGEMEYFGGTVFPSVEVVSVIWGSNVNSQTVATMPGFLSAIVNSTFLDMLGEYSTKGVKGVNGRTGKQTIKRGTFFGQVQITPKNTNTTITNKDIHNELEYQIAQGVLPPPSRNMLYMIYFPSNISIEAFKIFSCSSFGAYHFASDRRPSRTNIFYGVMPDCGYSVTSHEIVSAHEFAEATSDNIPTPGSNPKYPQAWNTSGGAEIGDLCEGTQGELTAGSTTYYVQQVYLNSTGACSTGNYHSP